MEMENEKELGFVYDTREYLERPYIVILNAPNVPVAINFKTSKQAHKITGLAVTASAADNDNARAISGCEFAEDLTAQGVQIFPKLWDLRFFATGLEVSPNERFWRDIDVPAETTLVEGSVRCTDTTPTLYPMALKFMFVCSIVK